MSGEPVTGGREPTRLPGRVLHPGETAGELCVIEPVSFWGGVNAEGRIIDVRHPSHGVSITGRMLALPSSKGSSSGSSVLAELIVQGRAPRALIVSEPDAILVSGCIAAAEISGIRLPVLEVSPEDWPLLRGWTRPGMRAALQVAERRIGDPGELVLGGAPPADRRRSR